jgi:hypothetical protein
VTEPAAAAISGSAFTFVSRLSGKPGAAWGPLLLENATLLVITASVFL